MRMREIDGRTFSFDASTSHVVDHLKCQVILVYFQWPPHVTGTGNHLVGEDQEARVIQGSVGEETDIVYYGRPRLQR